MNRLINISKRFLHKSKYTLPKHTKQIKNNKFTLYFSTIQEQHQCCGIGCQDCVLTQIKEIKNEKKISFPETEIDRVIKSSGYIPNDFINKNLYFIRN